jgi:hypothetical protein
MSGTNKKLSWFPPRIKLLVTPIFSPSLFLIHLTDNNSDGLTLFLTAGVKIGKMTPILRSKQPVSDICKCLFINLISLEYPVGGRVVLVSCALLDWKGVGGVGPTTQLVKLAVIWSNTPHYIHLDGGGVDRTP